MKEFNVPYIFSCLAVIGLIFVCSNVQANNKMIAQNVSESKIIKNENPWHQDFNEFKNKTVVQLERLNKSSADGVERIKEGFNTFLIKTDHFLKRLRNKYYHWQAETRIKNLIEKTEKLEDKVAGMDEKNITLFKKDFSMFSDLANEARNELKKLKEQDERNNFQPASLSLEKVETVSYRLERDVKLAESKQKLNDFSEKIKDLKTKEVLVTKDVSFEFKENLNNLERKLVVVKGNIDKLDKANKNNLGQTIKNVDLNFKEIEQTYNQTMRLAGSS